MVLFRRGCVPFVDDLPSGCRDGYPQGPTGFAAGKRVQLQVSGALLMHVR
jgi:hypothetical protein